jgi:hypothetical protein
VTAGRDTWFAGSAIVHGQRLGPPLGIRSVAANSSGSILFANVHVGGISGNPFHCAKCDFSGSSMPRIVSGYLKRSIPRCSRVPLPAIPESTGLLQRDPSRGTYA